MPIDSRQPRGSIPHLALRGFAASGIRAHRFPSQVPSTEAARRGRSRLAEVDRCDARCEGGWVKCPSRSAKVDDVPGKLKRRYGRAYHSRLRVVKEVIPCRASFYHRNAPGRRSGPVRRVEGSCNRNIVRFGGISSPASRVGEMEGGGRGEGPWMNANAPACYGSAPQQRRISTRFFPMCMERCARKGTSL